MPDFPASVSPQARAALSAIPPQNAATGLFTMIADWTVPGDSTIHAQGNGPGLRQGRHAAGGV